MHDNHPHLLPVVIVGSILSMCAGFTNAFALIGSTVSVSGVTGTITRIGVEWTFLRDGIAGLLLLLQVGCFSLGACIGGFLAPSRRMIFQLPYGTLLLVESVLLSTGLIVYFHGYPHEARFPWTVAMGIQNGMGTYYSNAVLRLTHMTGIVSDIGMILGEGLRRRTRTGDFWKLKIYFPVLFGYFVGGIIGALLAFNPLFMIIPTLIVFLFGLGFTLGRLFYVRRKLEELKEEESRRSETHTRKDSTVDELDMEPLEVGVNVTHESEHHHPHHPHHHHDEHHHHPNLLEILFPVPPGSDEEDLDTEGSSELPAGSLEEEHSSSAVRIGGKVDSSAFRGPDRKIQSMFSMESRVSSPRKSKRSHSTFDVSHKK